MPLLELELSTSFLPLAFCKARALVPPELPEEDHLDNICTEVPGALCDPSQCPLDARNWEKKMLTTIQGQVWEKVQFLERELTK